MDRPTPHHHPFRSFLLFFAIYSGAWLLQNLFFLNGDVSYCLQAARLLREGGNYAADFFNPNPPLILYLHFPVLLVHDWLQGNLALEFRIFVFLLASLSLGLCFKLAQRLVQPAHLLFFIATLAFLFLIAPLYHFGEREHLLFILTLPYLLLLACRLQAKTGIKNNTALLIGFLAALGFALKPPFLIVPLLLELYGLLVTRKFWFSLRIETVTLFVLLLVYLGSLFIFHPDFIFLVLPFILRNYYNSVSNPWQDVLLNPPCLFCFAVILFALAQRKTQTKETLRPILLLSLGGFLLADFAQQTSFFYHLLPALSVAILILLSELATLLRKTQQPNKLFWLLFGLLLLACLLPMAAQQYAKGREYKEQVLTKLIQFARTQTRPTSISVFARWGTYTFPVVDYIGSRSAQRFDCLWPVFGFVKEETLSKLLHLEPSQPDQLARDKNFFIEMIAQDLERHKPDLVLIDQEDRSLLELDSHFNYLDYFSENQHFRQAWKAYHYLTTLDDYPFYRLLVYQRN